MKCFGTCQFLRGLWYDITGTAAPLQMRTDANNLVTTAGTTHLPVQKETIHSIQMLRKEVCSGAIDDLGHLPTEYYLADPLTKATVSADQLRKAVTTGNLLMVDANPLSLSLNKHKAFTSEANYIAAYQALGEPSPYNGTAGSQRRHSLFAIILVYEKPYSTQLYIPVSVSRLLPARRSCAFRVDGHQHVHNDSWICNSRTHTGPLPTMETHWTGPTVFYLRKPACAT